MHVHVCVCVCASTCVCMWVCVYMSCLSFCCYFQDGYTPLHEAARYCHVSVVECLLTSGHSLEPKNYVSHNYYP